MSRRLTVLIALAAGLAGGLLSRYLVTPVVFAQNQPQVTKEVRAQSFTVVDAADHAIGTFSFEPDPGAPRLGSLQDSRNPRPAIPLGPGPGRIVLRDSGGNEIWSAGSRVKIQPLGAR